MPAVTEGKIVAHPNTPEAAAALIDVALSQPGPHLWQVPEHQAAVRLMLLQRGFLETTEIALMVKTVPARRFQQGFGRRGGPGLINAERSVHVEMDELLDVLPARVVTALRDWQDLSGLLEVVLDLGRVPEARFTTGDVALDQSPVTKEELEGVTQRVGDFGDDNRAGIERTLHRISAIRNRRGQVVGITCRVGRAVFGTIKIIDDLAFSGKNILLLGRPGVGKTTMLREMARVLSSDPEDSGEAGDHCRHVE